MPESIDLSESFWDNRYQNNETGWDIGGISTPLKAYADQLKNKDQKILIPGAGNAYEAEYLWYNGFKNVTVVDWSKTALNNITNRVPDFPKSQLIHGDFFELHYTFDLILEQTFFCAINPNLRQEYANKMHQLLNANGKLVGLLFNDKLNNDHPPFGGSKPEYINYFKPFFELEIMEACYNSIGSRDGRELFIKFTKK
ncbi:TPMT family class I SAM-dependent methyltransferase [Hanstruepera marina]|uniref:TPMT family class I SAM-dependent methyltransferase n=1 Tax=Hanstruepera marina TaxID=2873265 RepID=UPI0021067807|nr:TPMT family class I SAM-dependent methyltransferase [Hanstruepera marina]